MVLLNVCTDTEKNFEQVPQKKVAEIEPETSHLRAIRPPLQPLLMKNDARVSFFCITTVQRRPNF